MRINVNKKGSALVFAIILITNALIIVSSIVFLTSIQNKSAGSLFLTVKAFQKVDSGSELTLKKINDIVSTEGFQKTIDDLDLCDGGLNSSTGECVINTTELQDVSVWFYDLDRIEVLTDENETLNNVGHFKVLAKAQEGSNSVSRALRVSLFTSP
jgi:hypothetical protein